MGKELEEGTILDLDFGKIATIASTCNGVIPTVAQDTDTGRILMLAYVNEEALTTAIQQGVAVFWSTSRNALWIKGETSGDILELIEVRVNCEQNSILYLVRPKGKGTCHTLDEAGNSRSSCYYRVIENGGLKHVPYGAFPDEGKHSKG